MAVLKLDELTGDTASPSKARINLEDGSISRTWLARALDDKGKKLQDIQPQDVIDTENWFLGGTDTGKNGGRLKRTLPQADPMRPAWYVRSVDDSHGFGQFAKVPSLTLSLASGILSGALGSQPTKLPEFAMYKNWAFTVTYGPRPYPVLADSAVEHQSVDPASGMGFLWYLSTGPGSVFSPWSEWIRFMVFKQTAQNDYLTTQTGQFSFHTQSGQPPNLVPVTGALKQFLPNDLVQAVWYGVPERYVWSANSYLDKLRGTVNQYALVECPGEDGTKLVFPPGALQYLTYDYQTYSPPAQTLVQWSPSVAAPARLANITLTWLKTRRVAADAPAPANQNYIVDGHNAQAWVSKPGKFYYQTRSQAAGAVPTPNDPPMWLSAPHQLLWQDPDAPGAVQVPDVL